jgi:Domain of unknown function (DUF4383)
MTTKTVNTVLGIGFLLVGIAGFLAPSLLGLHLSPVHNAIHLVSGALALWLGLKGTLNANRTFGFGFGAVYALLGIAGFVAGSGNARLLAVAPNHLVLGTPDHIVHLILGLAFLAGAADPKRIAASA